MERRMGNSVSVSPVAFSSLIFICSLLSALAKAWVQVREKGGREGVWVCRRAPVIGGGRPRPTFRWALTLPHPAQLRLLPVTLSVGAKTVTAVLV